MEYEQAGGQAFPIQEQRFSDGVLNIEASPGMTLRDYFAAKAMQGMLSDSNRDNSFDEMAKYSYDMADLMLKARKS